MLVKWSAIRESGMRGGLEARLRRVDGEYRWFLFEAEPLRDEVGNIVKWYGSATDIEDRRQTEEELRRSEAKLAEAQRVSRTGSFVWNVSTGERFGSKEFFRILGYDRPRSVTFDMVLERAHPEDRARVERTIERSVREGRDLDYEHRLLMPDGSVKYVHVVAHAVRDQADQLEFIGAVVEAIGGCRVFVRRIARRRYAPRRRGRSSGRRLLGARLVAEADVAGARRVIGRGIGVAVRLDERPARAPRRRAACAAGRG